MRDDQTPGDGGERGPDEIMKSDSVNSAGIHISYREFYSKFEYPPLALKLSIVVQIMGCIDQCLMEIDGH